MTAVIPLAPQLRDPIVLVHGLLGFNQINAFDRPVAEYFPGIRAHMEASGNRVLMPQLSPTGSIVTRATQLRDFIRKELGSQPLHLIGHSMGGLDSRYLISSLGMADQVRSLTSIGTPHLGTSFADWGIRVFAGVLEPILRSIGLAYEAFFDLSTETCKQFNEANPDAPGVRYFSVAGDCSASLLGIEWKIPSRIVSDREGRNDGIVSVASATWGTETDIWEGDHLNLVNWPNRKALLKGITIDRLTDYSRLLKRLQDLGF